jgi:hypothetical protein
MIVNFGVELISGELTGAQASSLAWPESHPVSTLLDTQSGLSEN